MKADKKMTVCFRYLLYSVRMLNSCGKHIGLNAGIIVVVFGVDIFYITSQKLLINDLA